MTTLNHANVVTSTIVPIGTPVTIAQIHGIKPGMSNFTAGIRYFADANGDALATPGGGTVTISATGLATGQDTPITDGALAATDVTAFVEWKQYCTAVTATPAGVTTATHYQLHVIQGA